MATNYPGSLDSFTDPISSNALNSPSHAGQHTVANDAILALETKLGTTTTPALLAGGTSTASAAAFTTATPASGVAFTPLAASDSVAYIPIAATTTGTVAITMGPSTGAEHAIIPTSALVALSEPTFTLLVPKAWKVVVTIVGTTVVIGTVNIQAR